MEKTCNRLKMRGPISHTLNARFITCLRWSLFLLSAQMMWVEVACKRRPPPLTPPVSAPPARPDSKSPVDRGATRAPQLIVRVEPETIPRGASALLVWEAQNAHTVIISHNIGAVEPAGRIKFFPAETTTYRVSARGLGGATDRAVTVRVVGSEEGLIASEDLRGRPLRERFELSVRPVFFGFDSAKLSEDAKDILEESVRWLALQENLLIRFAIEGHCDDRGTEEYNLALGDKRARVVRAYLESLGVDPSRMETVSLGEETPTALRATEEAYSLNRRAQFVLLETPPWPLVEICGRTH